MSRNLVSAVVNGAARGFGLAMQKDQMEHRQAMDLAQEERSKEQHNWLRQQRDLLMRREEERQDLAEFNRHADFLLLTMDKMEDPEFASWVSQQPELIQRFNDSLGFVSDHVVNQSDDGSTKRLVGLVPVGKKMPNGKTPVSALLEVTREDGSVVRRPMTRGRSSDPDDPVVVFNPDDIKAWLQQNRFLSDQILAEKARAGDTSVMEQRREAQKLKQQRDIAIEDREDRQAHAFGIQRADQAFRRDMATFEADLKARNEVLKQTLKGDGNKVDLSPYNIQTGDNQIFRMVAANYGGSFDSELGSMVNLGSNATKAAAAADYAQRIHRAAFQDTSIPPAEMARMAYQFADMVPSKDEAEKIVRARGVRSNRVDQEAQKLIEQRKAAADSEFEAWFSERGFGSQGRAAPAAGSGIAAPPAGEETPPMEGARKANDGNWYVERNGQYFRVRAD